MSNAHFRKGSTTFICSACGHNTRNTGDQSMGSDLCPICWDLAGLENMIQDDQFFDNDAKEATHLFNAILKRNHKEFEKAKVSHSMVWEHELVKAVLANNLKEYGEKIKKDKAPAKTSKTKYDYPAGMTQEQKKVFRAKQRRAR